MGGRRSRGTGTVADDERLGVRRFRADLQGSRHNFRQDLLRARHLPARQGARAEGARHGCVHARPRRFRLVRPHRRRSRPQAAAAFRRHFRLYHPGSRHCREEVLGIQAGFAHLCRGRRAELPFPGAQAHTLQARLRMGGPDIPPLVRHGRAPRGQDEVARGHGGGRRRPTSRTRRRTGSIR